jgi:hypothetical protein
MVDLSVLKIARAGLAQKSLGPISDRARPLFIYGYAHDA